VETDRQTCLLGQQVDSPIGDLGQRSKRRGLLYARQRPPSSVTPGNCGNPC
jgi:hypothetical protein